MHCSQCQEECSHHLETFRKPDVCQVRLVAPGPQWVTRGFKLFPSLDYFIDCFPRSINPGVSFTGCAIPFPVFLKVSQGFRASITTGSIDLCTRLFLLTGMQCQVIQGPEFPGTISTGWSLCLMVGETSSGSSMAQGRGSQETRDSSRS